MHLPFVILSYGNWDAKNKKIFSYEHAGIHTLPIFTDIQAATQFATIMMTILRTNFADQRDLCPSVCSEPIAALHLFEALTAYCPDLMQITINPQPPLNDNTDYNNISVVEYTRAIDEVLTELHELVAGTSNTP